MGLNLQSLSITSAYNSIVAFFKSQENNSKWKDLTSGAEGTFLIRLLANVLSNISYKVVAARRENYLSTASMLSSVIGMAMTYGYSPFRGTNQKRLIEFTPNGNYTINKLSTLGTYSSEYDIISLEDVVLQANTSINIKTVVGKVKEITFTAGTTNIKSFSQYTDGISEDYVLLKDNLVVPTSNIYKELKNDTYLVRTNPSKSVDILYLNNKSTALYKYNSETEFTLRYVELANVEVTPYKNDMFNFGTLNNTLTIDNYIPFESVESIKINAPLHRDTQNLIRSKVDYSQSVKETVNNILETSHNPITPTYTLISYLKDDYTTVKQSEIISLNSLLVKENFFGTPLPDITLPKREQSSLDITLMLYSTYTNVSDVDLDISNLIKNNYKTKLNQTFNIYELERLLENSLPYVKYARVSYNILDRKDTFKYQLGNIIKVGSFHYKAEKILGTSGTIEPNWNLPTENIEGIDTKLETTEGSIIWRAYKRLNVPSISKWTSYGKHYIGDYVYSEGYPFYMFKCVDLIKITAPNTPDVSLVNVGDFLVDGNIVWVCKVYNLSYKSRENLKSYRLGESVNIGSSSFECISYVGETAGAQPSFEVTNYSIVATTSSSFIISGDKTSFFKQNDIIKAATTDNIYTFSVQKALYNPSNQTTTIIVNQEIDLAYTYTIITPTLRGTQDGELLWSLVADTTEISYDWNVYNIFSYNLTIKYGGN